ncbi:SF1B family DNA helicase RecD2 [Bombilactobacillus bombi]|uniref:SF1B family DNA helicase RecD2 n=1 Tax=Bombilactobacillus bombi TaxID=1303590 RepID=UPI002810F834|nr:ATP-dependent RecD-like DNA helicase [Bombilactobacillus bombi]
MAEKFVIGKVQAIFFEKPEDYFKIMMISVQETSFSWADHEIVVTGNFDELDETQNYKFFGQVVDHPKYGQQFKCEHYQKNSPTDRKSLIAYFSGTDFPGIGVKTAKKIVDVLGDNAIEILVQQPEALDQLHLQANKKKVVLEQIAATYQTEEVILKLNRWGFGNKMAFKIYHQYGGETIQIIHQNPYQLVRDIKGVGFKRADNLAENFGLSFDYPQRIEAGLLQVLSVLINATGDTYVHQDELLQQTLQMLNATRKQNITEEVLLKTLSTLIDTGKIKYEQQRYFPRYLYEDEWLIARQLKVIVDNFTPPHYTHKQVQTILRKIESDLHIKYDKNQIEAIYQGINSSVFLLTGGPGTGKTTIINGLVAAYAKLHEYSLDTHDYQDDPFPIRLAAPTGRAAKHLFESTNLPASTIHRLLGLTGQEELSNLELDYIAGKLLIIDETSMVDTELFKLLVTAIPLGMQVILVGDQDQLPSVGPGQVFSDLISSQAFKTIKLNKIYRQDKDSTIIELAHQVNLGEIDDNLFRNYPDRSFIECSSQQVSDVLRQIVVKSEQKGFTLDKLQVLAPMYRGPAGIDNLNHILQDTLNPLQQRSKTITFGDIEYRIGDKIVHLVNNVEANVFNGEIGTIIGITPAKLLPPADKGQGDLIHLDFDGQQVDYHKADLNNITLAYCTSIHKAQGSEFDLVILVLVNQHNRMLKRNLLYTAITRAKSKLIMLGNRSAYERAINDDSGRRNTLLKKRLQEVFALQETTTISNVEQTLTLEAIRNQEIDPLIGMDGLKPQDFMSETD